MSQESASSLKSPFLPIFLCSLALVFFFAWQWSIVLQQKTGLIAVQQSREQVVTQAKQVQGVLSKVATDLLELAKTDPDAKTIVQFYGIAQNAPAGK